MIEEANVNDLKSGSLNVLQGVNVNLFLGNRGVNDVNFNGLVQQHEEALGGVTAALDNSVHVLDAEGGNLTQELVSGASTTIKNSFGMADFMITTPTVLDYYSRELYERGRYLINTSGANTNGMETGNYVAGQRNPQGGFIKFHSDLFFSMEEVTWHYGAALNANYTLPIVDPTTGARALPAAPALAGVPIAAAGAGTSGTKFATAASVRYAVTSSNESGESAFNTTALAAIAVPASGAARLTITGVPTEADGVVIYRSKAGDNGADAKMYPILRVKKSELASGINGGTANQFIDKNQNLPDTDFAIIMNCRQKVIEFAKFGTLMKYDIARVQTADRYFVMLAGVPLLYAPRKMVLVKNLRRAPVDS